MEKLMPRRILFGDPAYADVKISRDGKFISWLAPFEDVVNIWLAPVDDILAARPLTRTKGRPIDLHWWMPDGGHILFVNDENGDENFHLFAVAPNTGNLRDLTPLPGIRVNNVAFSPDAPGRLVAWINDRDPRWHDLHEIDLTTGVRKLVWENTQNFNDVGVDWQLQARYAHSTTPDGGTQFWRIDGGEAAAWISAAFEDKLTTWPINFNRAGTHLYMRTSVGRDTSALARVDWRDRSETIISESPRGDFAGLITNPQTGEVDAAFIESARREVTYATPEIAADLDMIQERFGGLEFDVKSQTADNLQWIVQTLSPEQPSVFYRLDRVARSLSEIFTARPALKSYRLAPMQAIEAKARDGLNLVSYLTLPAGVHGARPPQALPMVLVVHGGPWARDSYGFRADHQWLADRGYAVLSVNYRGSTGFGKAFIAASEKEHAQKIHDDLIDMVNWTIDEGVADKEKVAVFGASYGGLASFIGATFTPDVFCCSVPVVGITNLQTLIESIPPYWSGFAEFMYRSYGDPRTPEGRALLAERSPINRVDNIRKPMLIFHGANDVRCKVSESDTIVAAMQSKNIPVTYVVYPDEGHGFRKEPNRLAYRALAEVFLARQLGGACEPMGRDLEGSSHEFRAGGECLDEILEQKIRSGRPSVTR